jgi:hypothetical protein
MITLIFFLLIAAGLLVLLIALSRRNPSAEGSAQALLEARNALQKLTLGLLPADFVEQIFARQDLDYVTANASKEIQQLFVDERKKIALAWVSEIHQQIIHLQHFHLGHSRHFARLNFPTEIALALDFAVLRLECRALYLLLLLRGPYGASYVVGKTAGAAARLCTISEKYLAFLTPAEGLPMPDDSAEGGAAI